MSEFIYIYTIVLLLAFAAAAFFSLAAFFVSGRKAMLARIGLFGAYSVGLIDIFGSEWATKSLAFASSGYYWVERPYARIVVSAAMLLCYWIIVAQIIDEHDRTRLAVPVVVYVLLEVLVVVAMPAGRLNQWTYYGLRQLFFAFTQLYAWRAYRRSTDQVFRDRLARYELTWKLMWLFIVCIVFEDTMVILVFPTPANELVALLFSARSLSENAMMAFLAYRTIRSSLDELTLRAQEAPQVSSDSDDVMTHIVEQLPAYASAHKLSNREREVLSMVLEGKDNRTIAAELFLSEGTIKTHVHNIMKKTGTGSRDELKKSFWSA